MDVNVNGKEISFELVGDKPMITSRQIAEHFGKRHDNFIQKIENDNAFAEFERDLKIKATVYEVQNPSGGEPIKRKMYLLDRDAFSYFVMGFTGKKASEWKLDYIKAFSSMEDIVKKIAEDGYYLTDKAKKHPSNKLVKDMSEIAKTRQALYHTREELMEIIAKFLYGDEWEEHSMATQMSRLHQYCHIALTLHTAQGVIESRTRDMKNGVSINSYLNMTYREPIKADYLVALNYYSEEDLKLYLDYFNTALRRVVHHIRAKHITPTTKSVIKMLNEIGLDVVKTTTPLQAGDVIETKNRKKFNDILNQHIAGQLTHDEFLDECSTIGAGKDFVL